MVLGFNNMNMLNMNNMFGMNCGSNIFGGNMLSSLFSGTGSIFGGGYNMFGGGCSLFTNCNGSYNYDAMAGFGVGMVLMNIGGAAISQAVADRKANSTEALDAKADAVSKKIEAKEKALTKEEKTLSSLEKALPDLEIAKTDATKSYNTANDYITNNKYAYDAAIARQNNNETLTEQEKNIIQNYEDYKAKLPDLKKAKELAEKEVEEQKRDIDDQKQIVADIKDDIRDLEDELELLEGDLDDKILDKADGNKLQRTSETDFKNLFDDKGNFVSQRQKTVKAKDGSETEVTENVKVSKSDVRYAILGYRNAQTAQDRESWAAKFKTLYNELSEEDKNDKNLSAAYGIICG